MSEGFEPTRNKLTRPCIDVSLPDITLDQYIRITDYDCLFCERDTDRNKMDRRYATE